MDRSEVQRLIPDALDGYLTREQLQIFLRELERYPDCRTEYYTELATRDFVRARLSPISAPPHVRHGIIQSVHSKSTPRIRGVVSWMFGPTPYAPALVSAAAVVLLIIVSFFGQSIGLTPPEHNDGIAGVMRAGYGGTDAILRSAAAFGKILRGEFSPSLRAERCEEISKYFEDRQIPFSVVVPRVNNAEWMGAHYSEHSGTGFAHIVYKLGGKTLYVFEAHCDEVLNEGGAMSVSPNVRERLLQGLRYVHSCSLCTVIAVMKGKTFCIYVSEMPENDLMNALGEQS